MHSRQPNIVWITCEDMSLHLGCYGEKLINTPNLDALAADAVLYTNAYTVSGVCAPSRNGIITCRYPTSNGADNMRNYRPNEKETIGNDKLPASYSVVPPADVKCFPELLRLNGYYCTNNPKEDYQFEAPVTVWNESGSKAHWNKRNADVPFFAVFNLMITHESQLWGRDSFPLLVDPSKVTVPSYYPDIPEVRNAIARQLSNVQEMDKKVGAIIKQLKDSGLYENACIFFYSDHGDGLPYVKREITQRGIHIPLLVKLPHGERRNTIENILVSSIDFGPAVLEMANIEKPPYMHGVSFLPENYSGRKYVVAARDRMDECVDRARSVFDGRFQYIKNDYPDLPYYQPLQYRLSLPMMRRMLAMRDSGLLSKIQMRWFEKKVAAEELYDVQKDPFQLVNLAGLNVYKETLEKLRADYHEWCNDYEDWNRLDEKEMVKKMWNGAAEMPVTAMPELIKAENGFMLNCSTEGASLAYKKIKPNSNATKTSWEVYRKNEIINFDKEEKLVVRAQRIGYAASEMSYNNVDTK